MYWPVLFIAFDAWQDTSNTLADDSIKVYYNGTMPLSIIMRSTV